MRLGRLAHDRQAEPGAGQRPRSVGSEEALEHAWQVVGLEARPMVANAERAVAQLHLDQSARRAPAASVVQEVGDRAADALGLAGDDRRLDLRLERRSIAGAALCAI